MLATDPDALRGSFGFYRAIPTSAAQNEERKDRRLTMPVLAMGGEESGGENAANAMKLVADEVAERRPPRQPATGSPSRPPTQLLAALTEFLAPYRDQAGGHHD